MPPTSWTSKGRMPKHAARGLAHGGEGRHQEIVERSAVGEIGAELVGAGGKLGVGKRPELVLHGVDRLDPWPRRLDAAIVGGAEDLAGEDAETDHQMVLSTVSFAGGRRRNPRYPAGEADSANSKKRPENGSGRKDAGQIRGASTDVNARIRAI